MPPYYNCFGGACQMSMATRPAPVCCGGEAFPASGCFGSSSAVREPLVGAREFVECFAPTLGDNSPSGPNNAIMGRRSACQCLTVCQARGLGSDEESAFLDRDCHQYYRPGFCFPAGELCCRLAGAAGCELLVPGPVHRASGGVPGAARLSLAGAVLPAAGAAPHESLCRDQCRLSLEQHLSRSPGRRGAGVSHRRHRGCEPHGSLFDHRRRAGAGCPVGGGGLFHRPALCPPA